MQLKRGIRILAIDDSHFTKEDGRALAVGVVGRPGVIEGILSFRVAVDGNEATRALIHRVRTSKFAGQIKLIVTNGITLAGLNMLDLEEISERLRVPVVSIVRRRPHKTRLEAAIRKSGKDVRVKLALLKKLNANLSIKRVEGLYVQPAGISNEAFKPMQANAYYFLRLAHLIASGVAKGESRGRV
jgi:endonuclease V-like protein UPF0215 family